MSSPKAAASKAAHKATQKPRVARPRAAANAKAIVQTAGAADDAALRLAADIEAGLDQQLLQFLRLLRTERRRGSAVAAPHRRGAAEPRRVVGGGRGIDEGRVPLEVGLEVVEHQEGRAEPDHGE